jgi:hypothetical protein
MRRVCWTILPVLFCLGFLASKSAVAQDQTPAQNPPAKPQSAKDRKQQARKLAKESAPYNTRLTEEVVYIITKEEADAFLASPPTKSASSTSKNFGGAAIPIPIPPITPRAKNTIAASPTPTIASPPASLAGKPIVAASTFSGALPTKSSRTPQAAPTIARPSKAAERRRREPSSGCGRLYNH